MLVVKASVATASVAAAMYGWALLRSALQPQQVLQQLDRTAGPRNMAEWHATGGYSWTTRSSRTGL
jgi:hypothetical protein